MSEPEELSELWLLDRMRERKHIVAALVLGLSHWPRVLEIIASCDEVTEACAQLSAEFGLDQIQSNTVLDAQVRRLVGSSRSWLEAELSELHARTTELERIVAEDPERAKRAPTPTVVMITVDEVMPLLLAAVPSLGGRERQVVARTERRLVESPTAARPTDRLSRRTSGPRHLR